MNSEKEFYFVRHGQTDANLSPVKVDYDDIALNETGKKQALAIEPYIATLPIKSICYSPLKRAVETKNLISRRLQALQHEIVHLGECNAWIWNDMTSGFIQTTHVSSFIERAVSGINQSLVKEGPVLIVAHGGIHWAFCHAMAISDHNWFIDNCHPVHFILKEEQWRAKPLL